MAKLMVNWQIGRFVHAQEAADTVPANIRGFLDQPGIHTSNRVFALEKIAGLIEAGAEKISIVSRADHPLTSLVPAVENRMSSTDSRSNMIVLADSADAVAMVNEPQGWTSITLRIGFLEGQLDKLPQFLDAFDIVIADDQGMDLPMRIFEEIAATANQK